MNPMNYLYFTLLSIFIQFCLMDIIMEEFKSNGSITTNSTIEGVDLTFEELAQKPHALYYRTKQNGITDKFNLQNIKYNNSTIVQSSLFPTTELMSTSFDLVYDENASLVNDDFTTEPFQSTTEVDNVTEITYIDKATTITPVEKTKKPKDQNKICNCNLLYQVCDINCCCDADCTKDEQLAFKNFTQEVCNVNEKLDNWESSTYNICDREIGFNAFEKLFCISKINLPERKNIVQLNKVDDSAIVNHFKWHISDRPVTNSYEEHKYHHGDLVWVSKNETFDNIELPIPVINNYCFDKKAIRFLVNEDIRCNVKLKDLHMLQIINQNQQSSLISMFNSANSTVMNCTTLQCVNWTLLVCKTQECEVYTQKLHEPSCTASHCTNIALKIDYNIYCNTTGLTNATIKFFTQTISLKHEYIRQEIEVNFYMTNVTNNIVELSGNPGYKFGLPVIKSIVESNHTNTFFNISQLSRNKSYFVLPRNKDGVCIIDGNSHKILFGENKRLKCRLFFKDFKFTNGTEGCVKIQSQINDFLELNQDIYISPYGNPQRTASDQNWILLTQLDRNIMYGTYRSKQSQLMCFDIVTRVAFVIVYANMASQHHAENKIMSAKVEFSFRNLTFKIEENISAIITIDINFIDGSKPVERIYAGAPRLNINLPKNFFLPFY